MRRTDQLKSSFQYRLRLHYDFSWKMWRASSSYLLYVFSRIVGQENNRIKKSIETAKTFVESSVTQNTSLVFYPASIKEENPYDLATKCLDKHGFYPISFVLMRDFSPSELRAEKSKLLSDVIPGEAYSFTRESDLYTEYRISEFAFTYRKCGWDSYRNLEILSQGTFPLYLDVGKIPRFCMSFYPKNHIRHVTERFMKSPFRLSREFKEEFFERGLEHLSSEFLKEYLVEIVGNTPNSILFFDASLDSFKGDYQSMMTLNALSKIAEANVTVFQNLDYLFSREVSNDDLYGRGFGYLGLLENSRVQRRTDFQSELIDEFDWLVVGSAARNMDFIKSLDSKRNQRTILVWGEDRPPTRLELKELRSKSQYCFVREVAHPFVIP